MQNVPITVTLTVKHWHAISQLIIANAERSTPLTGADQVAVLHEALNAIHSADMADLNQRLTANN